ncbi:acyltransferase [bacterium]|nr:acyltransferase [candidate division CSSED10-310 bacterium]
MTIWIAIIVVAAILLLAGFRGYIRKLHVSIGLCRFVWEYLLLEPVVFLFRWCPGGYGIVARYVLYKLLLKHQGRNVTIRDGVKIMYPERVSIGDNSGVNDSCFLEGTGGITIGRFVRLAPRVEIMTSNHNFSDPDVPIKLQGLTAKPVTIQDDVWVGIGVLVTSGVTIGQGAVVAGHAVVTRDVPPFSIVGGIPAAVIGWRKTPEAVGEAAGAGPGADTGHDPEAPA